MRAKKADIQSIENAVVKQKPSTPRYARVSMRRPKANAMAAGGGAVLNVIIYR